MLNRFAAFGILLLVLLFSCKKEEGPWDRELNMVTDTTTMIYKISYVSNTSSQLVATVDMVKLVGLQSATNYTGSNFSNVSTTANVDYTASGISSSSPTTTSYSSVLLFNLNLKEWYAEHDMGFYMRRFFEIVDGSNTKQIALSSFSGQENTKTRFHAEDHSDLFGNSWEYNTATFYDLTTGSAGYHYQTTLGYLQNRIEDIIDTLSTVSPSGAKSITLVSNTDFFNTADTLIVNSIINKANANQTSINLVGVSFPDQLRQIANETGGFISEEIIDYGTDQVIYKPTAQISHVGVTLQNLDNLLAKNVKINRCTYQFDFNDGSVYLPGDIVAYPINYNGLKFFVDLSIP